MNIKQQFTTVTRFSKIVALILFISLPFVGFYLGMQYKKGIDSLALNLPQVSSQQKPTACTQEAKVCPDGSSVGRTGPNCEFAACPENKSVSEKIECKENSKYFVVSKEYNLAGVQINDFLVKNKSTKNEVESCQYFKEEGDFEMKGVEGANLLALTDNFLVLDGGYTNGFTMYDLALRKKVYTDKLALSYGSVDTPITTKGDVITYWIPVDKKATIENCSKLKDAGEGGVGFRAHMSLDLSNLNKKDLGEYECFWIQG